MRIIPDKSWIDIPRLERFRDTRYKEGCDAFMQYAEMNPRNLSSGAMYCPCCRCRNMKLLNRNDIRLHLIKSGFDEKYKYWSYHGEDCIEDEEPNMHVGTSGGLRIDDTGSSMSSTAASTATKEAATLHMSQEEAEGEPDPHMLSAEDNIILTQNVLGYNRRGRYPLHGVRASPGISIRSFTGSSMSSTAASTAQANISVMPLVLRVSGFLRGKINSELHVQVTKDMSSVVLRARTMDEVMSYIIGCLAGVIPADLFGDVIGLINSGAGNAGFGQSSAQVIPLCLQWLFASIKDAGSDNIQLWP